MEPLSVDGLVFDFPAEWQAAKYDDWAFYRHQFAKQRQGIKAVDILVIAPGIQDIYLVEVKDYRHPNTAKPSSLAEAIGDKVLHTLAAMLPARLYANDDTERQMAADVLNCKTLTVVVHIEQPTGHRFVVDPADLKQKLKRYLRAIDPHPKVCSMNNMAGLSWSVS